MSDERTERRLRATLSDQAEQVDSHLSGPELRRRASGRDPSDRVRRLAPVLAAAAAVAVIATVGAVISSDDGPGERSPVQPGGQTAATSATPSPVPSVTPTPTATPTAASTTAPRPTVSAQSVTGSASPSYPRSTTARATPTSQPSSSSGP